MTNNTIPNVPRELLERVLYLMDNYIGTTHTEEDELRALLSAPSPAGVDGLEVVGYLTPHALEVDMQQADDEPLCRLSDAQAIIDGLRGEVADLLSMLATVSKAGLRVRTERDQQAQRIGELAELAAQASVNCKNTAYYLRKYRPDLADICSGWCVAIDAALSAGKEGE